MVKDEILSWLENDTPISDSLRAHLDLNLKRFGSWFYPPEAFTTSSPPSELDYQISKGFVSFYVKSTTTIFNKLIEDKAIDLSLGLEPILNDDFLKLFMNEFNPLLIKTALHKNISHIELFLMSSAADMLSIQRPKPNSSFSEIDLVSQHLAGILFSVFTKSGIIRNPKFSDMISKLINRNYNTLPEENEFLKLLDQFMDDTNATRVINSYKLRHMPEIENVSLSSLNIVTSIHTFLRNALSSDTDLYILDSDRVKSRLTEIADYSIIIPEDVHKQLNTARLLYENPVLIKQILRNNALNDNEHNLSEILIADLDL